MSVTSQLILDFRDTGYAAIRMGKKPELKLGCVIAFDIVVI
jgi:hypothetical protein